MKKGVVIKVAWALIICAAGVVLGHLIWPATKGPASAQAPSGQVRANLPQYKFINPLLYSENDRSAEPEFQALASQIGSYVSSAEKNGSAKSISVYFRDLNTGRWTGVDEDELYAPSSMLKVMAMIAALKLAEQDPAILSEKLYYHRSGQDNTYYFKADDNVTDGYYTLSDLIGIMIKHSDNDAFNAIVGDPKINASFTEMYLLFGLPERGLEGSDKDFMSPKSFSTIFRTLYNSSLFEWNLSEQVLDLLSQTTFKQGLVDGVPASTTIAHKFGENVGELHDCGIVYHPGNPYLLCVMTRGTDMSKLESVISGISEIAWDFAEAGDIVKNK